VGEKEYKSPITAVSEINGYLVACIGQKVFLSFHFQVFFVF